MSSSWVHCPHCKVLLQPPAGTASLTCASCGKTTPLTAAEPPPGGGWYVVQNKLKVGPLSAATVGKLLTAGRLAPDDMVLPADGQKWVALSSVPELVRLLPASGGPPAATVAYTPPPEPVTGRGTAETTTDTARTVDPTPGDSGRTTPWVPAPGPTPGKVPLPSIPGYEILQVLGRGGMGVVYKARHLQLKRLVALKMILAGGHADAADLARFRAEAEAVARLQHPNIVQIHETGEHDGQPYFSLEYIDGGTLAGRLDGTPLPPRDAATLSAVLAAAVEAAHRRGVVHRDLKPANILLHGDKNSPLLQCTPKVADFGLAKQLDDDSGQTRTGAIMGTPSYMSPEQASGRTAAVGPATDVYALGAILYELLTGRPPFRAATTLDTLEQVRRQEPVPPRSLQPGLPRDLETTTLKCLQKDPARRYPSAQGLADDLRRYLGNQPILARPASWREVAWKWALRNKAASTVILSLVFFGFISLLLLMSERSARAGAELANREKARQLAVTEATLGTNASQRGDYKKAVEHWEAAIAGGHPDVIPLRLRQARAYASLYDRDSAKKILDKVAGHPRRRDHEAEVLLIRGEIALEEGHDDAMNLFRDAIGKGLSPADRAYAEGCLSEAAPEAVGHLREAVALDPYHHQARIYLGMTLFFLGRVQESREVAVASSALFRNDASFRILLALISALRDDRLEMQAQLQALQPMMSPAEFTQLRQATQLLELVAAWDRTPGVQPLERMTELARKGGGDLSGIWTTVKGIADKGPQAGGPLFLRLPPSMARLLQQILLNGDVVQLYTRPQDFLSQMEQTVEKHPEGGLYFFLGSLQLALGKHREAERSLLKAVEQPSLGNIKVPALVQAIRAADYLAWKENDAAAGQRAHQNLAKLLQGGPVPPEFATDMLAAAMRAQDLSMARRVMVDGEPSHTEDPLFLRLKLEIHLGSREYAAALQTADRILELEPGNQGARDARARALQGLRILVNNAG